MPDWVIPVVIIAVVVLIVIIIVVWAVSTRNKFVEMRNSTEEAFATIDIYLKKRYDLIPNLVETAKGYAKYESQTIENVIRARNNAANASTTAQKIEADANLSHAIKSFNVVAERYPELKANANFQSLMAELRSIEGELANARKYYNATVKIFNTKKDIFPKSIIANRMKLEKFPYFELENSEERKNIKVSF